ncbi:DUF262 domain-containing protein [Rhodococcus sp. 5A-K4]|uniref:DUF262 domain-containing protein n=1 Tax=Rhodococcus sp. 5A-K4 TaxID=3384442 RepID=UPI0038D35B89
MSIPSPFDKLEDQLSAERKKVDVAYHDFSVRELVRMLAEHELNIAPEYQRKYRWKADVASTFIESVLLGLPIPPIFVATDIGYQWEVVDGLQRLSSLLLFCAPDDEALKLVKRTQPLKLENLQKLTQLNGLQFSDFPKPIQMYFNRQPLKLISLTDKSDPTVRFDLFERLNAGAISLTPQEVRACIYRGEFNTFIERLGESSDFTSLLKLDSAAEKDGTPTEEVLKYFAYKNSQSTFSGKVKEFLNKYMDTAMKSFDYEKEEDVFTQATSFLVTATGGRPFLRSGANITPTVAFEACLVAAARIIESGRNPEVQDLDWINDPQLREYSRGGSNTKPLLEKRIQRASELFGA